MTIRTLLCALICVALGLVALPTSANAQTPDAPAAPPAADPAPAEAAPTAPAPVAPAPAPAPAPAEKKDDAAALLDELESAFAETPVEGPVMAPPEATHAYPYVEQHGSFRFRPDLMYRLHLGTQTRVGGQTIGTSGVRPPLTENVINNEGPLFGADVVGSQGEDVLAGANMRFRYTPTFHVSSSLKVQLQLDILDNHVLGTTPDFDATRPDAPLAAFSGSQTSPEAGRNGHRDAVRVKQAFGEWKTPLGVVRLGRQASHWGLGLLANGGQHWDADYGDFVDRALLLTRIPGIDLFYVVGAWDFVQAGKTSDDATQFFGQPHDLTEQDDVREAVLAIFDRPIRPEEKARYHHRLRVAHEPVVQWGLYYVWRAQDLDISPDSQPVFDTPFDEVELISRDAVAHIPDFWLRLDWSPSDGQLLHIELEAVTIFGEIGNVIDSDPTRDGQRDIRMWGGAAEIDWTSNENRLTVGLQLGAASGDDAEYFGVLDQKNFSNPDGSANKTITNFKFDRGFTTDRILFREVIGAVTNAMYIKPFIEWDFLEPPEAALGMRLDIEHARALKKTATPGDSAVLGTELDVSFFFEEEDVFRADIISAFMFPGGAFNLKKGFEQSLEDKDAKMAFRLSGRLIWMF